MSAERGALEIPEGVSDDPDPQELVRFWVGSDDDYVTLRIGAFDPAQEAHVWGNIIADIARHAVQGLLDQNSGGSEETLLAQIEAGFAERLADRPDYSAQPRGAQ